MRRRKTEDEKERLRARRRGSISPHYDTRPYRSVVIINFIIQAVSSPHPVNACVGQTTIIIIPSVLLSSPHIRSWKEFIPLFHDIDEAFITLQIYLTKNSSSHPQVFARLE